MATIERSAVAAGRSAADIEVVLPAFVVTGADEDEMAAVAEAVRQQVAFYGSTPAYRGVLDHHGWGDAHSELNAMSKRGEWEAMADVIDDDLLVEFAVVAELDDIAAKILERYAGIVDRLSLYPMPGTSAGTWDKVIDDLTAG